MDLLNTLQLFFGGMFLLTLVIAFVIPGGNSF